MTPDLDTIRLLKEIERLQKLIASKTMATFEWALEQKTLRAERDAALAEIERLRKAVGEQTEAHRKYLNRAQGLKHKHRKHLAAILGNVEALVVERDAALAECERLRQDVLIVKAGKEEIKAQRDTALAEIERLRK